MEFGGLNVKTAIKGLGAVDAGSTVIQQDLSSILKTMMMAV